MGRAVGSYRALACQGAGFRRPGGEPEFVPLLAPDILVGTIAQALWDRATNASRRMAERFAACGGVGQIYDEKSKAFDTVVKEYLLAWAALLDDGDPQLALAQHRRSPIAVRADDRADCPAQSSAARGLACGL